jgi:hypothetical protein
MPPACCCHTDTHAPAVPAPQYLRELSGRPAHSPDPTRQVLLDQLGGLVRAAARQAGKEGRLQYGQQLLVELQGGWQGPWHDVWLLAGTCTQWLN